MFLQLAWATDIEVFKNTFCRHLFSDDIGVFSFSSFVFSVYGSKYISCKCLVSLWFGHLIYMAVGRRYEWLIYFLQFRVS